MPHNLRLPALVHHKPTGQARVRINGRDIYCGRYGTPEANEKYRHVLADYLAQRSTYPPPGDAASAPAGPSLSINELIVAYWRHAQSYYRKNGEPTSQVAVLRGTLRLFREHYGLEPAASFGPVRLAALREVMIATGWNRNTINARIGQIKQVFRWAVSVELVPASVYQGLLAISGLRRGRSAARESEPVRPVPEAHVDSTLPFLPPQIRAMVQLQLLAGCRPGEICSIRPCDVTRAGDVWEFAPATHKTEHHGQQRLIQFGPRAQSVLAPYLERPSDSYCFSPSEAEAERNARRRLSRRTPPGRGNEPGTNRKPSRKYPPGSMYSPAAYRQAVKRACRKAGVPVWKPNQLRHSRATEIRRSYGIEVARMILGHGTPRTTELYAETDARQAKEVMREIG